MKLQYITNQSNNIKSESKIKWQFLPILDLKSYDFYLTDRRVQVLFMETGSETSRTRQNDILNVKMLKRIFFVRVVRLNKPMKKIWNKSNISINIV